MTPPIEAVWRLEATRLTGALLRADAGEFRPNSDIHCLDLVAPELPVELPHRQLPL